MDYFTSDNIPENIKNQIKINANIVNCDHLKVANKEIEYTLQDLKDVSISNLQNNQVLTYDQTDDKFKNKNIETSLINLSDVQLQSLNNGQILKFVTSENKWVNDDMPPPPVVKENLSELNDVLINNTNDRDFLIFDASTQKWSNKKVEVSDVVNITDISAGDLIVYNGSEWINRYPTEWPVKSSTEEISGNWNFSGDTFTLNTYKVGYNKINNELQTQETVVVINDNTSAPIIRFNDGIKGNVILSRNSGIFINNEVNTASFNIEPPETGYSGFTLKPPSLVPETNAKIIVNITPSEIIFNTNATNQTIIKMNHLSGDILNDKLICVKDSGYNIFNGLTYSNLQPPFGCIIFNNEVTPYTYTTPASINTWMTLVPVTMLCPDSSFFSNPSNGVLRCDDTFTWKYEINFTIVCSVDVNGRNLRFQLTKSNVPEGMITDFWFPAGNRYETIHGRVITDIRGSEVSSGTSNEELKIRCSSSSHTNIPVNISYFSIDCKAIKLKSKP